MASREVCRICLRVDVRMSILKNSDLQNLYKTLTSSFINKDERPLIVCFICHAKLKRCRRLQQQAIESNAVLEQLLAGGSMSLPKPHNARDEIKFTPVYHVDIWPVECDIENDCQDKNFNLESVKVEEENLENKNSKFEENGNLQTVTDGKAEDLEIDALGDSQTDSEDDLPLIAISSKKKQKSKAVKFKKKRKNNKKDDNDIDIEAIANEIILTVEEQRQEILDRASSENYLNAMYKCEKCYKGFVHPQAFSNHMNRHDQKSGEHECELCHMRYSCVRLLRAHVNAAHARRYACRRCPYLSQTRCKAREHEMWHNGHTYPCQICGVIFEKPSTYHTHTRKHHSEKVCIRCGCSFIGKHGLFMHLKKAHKMDEPEQVNPDGSASERFCSKCNIQFLTSNAWKRHVLTSSQHAVTKESSYQCALCGEQVTPLSRSSHMRYHIRELNLQYKPTYTNVSSPTLQCEQCEAQFARRSYLEAHVKRVHLGYKYDKNIVCEVCAKKCPAHSCQRTGWKIARDHFRTWSFTYVPLIMTPPGRGIPRLVPVAPRRLLESPTFTDSDKEPMNDHELPLSRTPPPPYSAHSPSPSTYSPCVVRQHKRG